MPSAFASQRSDLGSFPGLFKALFNVNEVITSIMFNWIAMFLVNLLIANIPVMLASAWGASNSDRTAAWPRKSRRLSQKGV